MLVASVIEYPTTAATLTSVKSTCHQRKDLKVSPGCFTTNHETATGHHAISELNIAGRPQVFVQDTNRKGPTWFARNERATARNATA